MQKKIRCVITDDEPMARKGIQEYVERLNNLELTGICRDALELNQLLQEKPVDLVFLDIEMPLLSGIDLLKGLVNAPKVIITTAFEKYALTGYELDVCDYLLKPISFERFVKAVNKAQRAFTETKDAGRDSFFIKSDHAIRKIRFDEILFVEAMENYVIIHLPGEKVVTHSTLRNMGELLPPRFLQVHKSFIVNKEHIHEIEGNMLKIENASIPVGRTQRSEVFRELLSDK